MLFAMKPEDAYDYPTRYREGFTLPEILSMLRDNPELNNDYFHAALMGVTGLIIDGNMVIYHCDVETAIRCAREARNIRFSEWD